MPKLKDLSVKVGTYEKNGETKNRYENIGSLMEAADGGQFILLKRTFNLAGVEVQPGKDSVMVSLFDPKPANGGDVPF